MVPYFDYKQELYMILCFLINPVICCIGYYIFRPQRIWFSPLIIMSLFVCISIAFYPYYFTDVFQSEYDSTTLYWMILFIPFQLMSALLFTAATYTIIRLKKKI